MMQTFLKSVRCSFGLVICLLLTDVATAQQFRAVQRGGGFGGRPNSVLNVFRDEKVASELKITEEQKKLIDEIVQNSRPAAEDTGAVFEKLRSAKTDEERDAARAELKALSDVAIKLGEAKLKKVIDEKQYERAVQLYLQQTGPRALTDERYSKQIGLKDEQVSRIEELIEKRDQAMRDLGFRSSDKEREEVRNQFETDAMKVLNEQQQVAWTKALGAPLVEDDKQVPESTSNPPKVDVATQDNPNEMPAKNPMDGSDTRSSDEKQAVVSFGTSSDEKGTTPITGNDPNTEQSLSFNFRYAPWSDVLTLFAELSGLTLDLNDVPPGTFNYYDKKTYTPLEALDVLNGYLLQKGYILVKRDQFLVCLNIDNGVPPNLIPNVEVSDLPKRGKNELMSVVFKLDEIEAKDIDNEIGELVGPQGKVVALENSNSLFVTGIGQNLSRIHRLLSGVSGKEDPEAIQYRAFVIKHIPAADAQKMVAGVLGIDTGVKNVSSSMESMRYQMSRDSRYRYPTPPGGSAPEPTSSSSGKTRVTVDYRTNQLLISAKASDMELVEKALETIDVEFDAAGNRFVATNNTPELRVYTVTTTDAREVAKTLDVVVPGVVVNEDGKAGKIHIVATPTEHTEIDALIRKLDGGGGSMAVSVLPLVSMDPLDVAITLQSMFSGDGDKAPTIEADVYGRRILVRGTQDQLIQIKSLLSQLGQDGTSADLAGVSRGPVRTYSLGGRDPDQVLKLLEQVWERRSPNPLRIVKPDERKKINPVKPTEKNENESTEPVDDTTDKSASAPARRTLLNVQMASQEKTLSDESGATQNNSTEGKPASKDETKTDTKTEKDDSESAPVMITINGDDLTLVSRDEEALDELEDLLQALSQSIPVQTTWTIFYLKVADATEAAAMLEQIFPSSSVSMSSTSTGDDMMSSMAGGISSFGSSLMDMTGLSGLGTSSQTLRIIPELRLNALFVTGPVYQVREVEQMLEVLDSAELPDTLRERVPRMIPVNHADVNEVAGILREVYKDALQDPAQFARAGGSRGGSPGGRGGGSNPIAALLGGGGGNAEVPKIKLTLGVDDRTSNLIVSADDALYQEIKSLVESIDDAALQAKRTVVVVPLENTNPVVIQQTLGSLMPRVKVSTSGTSRRPSSSQSGNPSTPTPSAPNVQQDNGPPEEVRRFFEDRIRERFQGGGFPGGGNSGIRRPGGDSGDGGGRGPGGSGRGPGGGRGGDRGRGGR